MEVKWEIIDAVREASTGKVISVSYIVSASIGELRQQIFAKLDLDEPKDIEKIIKFEDLKPETVIGWVKDKLGKESFKLEEAVATKLMEIKKKEDKKTKVNGLPW